ncbi:MAG: glycosyltransferase [Pseudomonadota bacterium]
MTPNKDIPMRITVIMCTRNRARQLENVLETFVALTPPVDAVWDMLVVDNGSTDDTAAVIDGFADRLPLRRIAEPKPGLSNARNAGVRAATGDYICWTDDDVELDPGWLAAYARAFHRYPNGTIFGGVVEPVFEAPPPDWLVESGPLLAAMLAKRDQGPVEKLVPADLHFLPYGANFAVRTREQKLCDYDPELGVSPAHRRLGEETCVLRTIAAMGGEQHWIPDSRVRHIIPAGRLNFDYVRTYFHAVGETWAYLSARQGPDVMGTPIPPGGRRILGVPLWIWRKSIHLDLRYRAKRALGWHPRTWLEDLTAKSRLIGARSFLLRHRSQP